MKQSPIKRRSNELQRPKSPELQKKLKSIKTPEELLALAKEESYELSDVYGMLLLVISRHSDCYGFC